MARYKQHYIEIESPLFKRTTGETRYDAMSADEREAHDASLSEDESGDYIQEGIYGKELAAYFEHALRGVGHEIKDNFVEDYGRVITIENVNGKRVQVALSNFDQENAQTDGTHHMLQVTSLPSLKSRFLRDQELSSLSTTIAAHLEKLINDDPKITILKKETY